MAKILLINSNRFKHPWPVIPFGLCYIATILEANGSHNVWDATYANPDLYSWFLTYKN